MNHHHHHFIGTSGCLQDLWYSLWSVLICFTMVIHLRLNQLFLWKYTSFVVMMMIKTDGDDDNDDDDDDDVADDNDLDDDGCGNDHLDDDFDDYFDLMLMVTIVMDTNNDLTI